MWEACKRRESKVIPQVLAWAPISMVMLWLVLENWFWDAYETSPVRYMDHVFGYIDLKFRAGHYGLEGGIYWSRGCMWDHLGQYGQWDEPGVLGMVLVNFNVWELNRRGGASRETWVRLLKKLVKNQEHVVCWHWVKSVCGVFLFVLRRKW